MRPSCFNNCTRVVRGVQPSQTLNCVLPDSDLEHAAEQLRVVGDNPSDMDDQLLLKGGLPLPAMRGALAVDDALDHPWRQRVGDHHLLLPEQAEGHLVITGVSNCAHSWGRGREHTQKDCV